MTVALDAAQETLQETLFGFHHDRILRAVNRYHVLTAEQVRRLYYRSSIAHCQKLLRWLTDRAYLFRVPLPRFNSFGKLP